MEKHSCYVKYLHNISDFVTLPTKKPKIFTPALHRKHLLTSGLDPTNLTQRYLLLVPGPCLPRGAKDVKSTISPYS